MKLTHVYTVAISIVVLASTSACEKLVEIPESKNQIETSIVFGDSAMTTSALLSIYTTVATNVNADNKYLGLYADDYIHTSPGVGTSLLQFNQSQLTIVNNDNTNLWGSLYSAVYQSNAIIHGVEQSNGLSVGAKKMFKGEAKFLRAFANFYLVNLYERVPLLLTTDVNQNRRASQSEKSSVYDQIINDLQDAKIDLGKNYIGNGKVRANSLVASALLSRVYLFQGNWPEAENEANIVISSGQYSPLPKLEDVFLANSKEAIFQLWNQNGFIADATALLPSSSTALPPYTLRLELFQAFESIDGRKNKWIGTNLNMGVSYNYPSKYKNRTVNTSRPEYVMALRLAEQYLIRAEARAQQNHIIGAVADLNVIRSRAGLRPLSGQIGKQECMEAVAKERRLELFGEWGHRFLDLKRNGMLDAVMGTLKTTWKSTAKALPIPNTEITYNSNLIQNDGY